MTVIAPLVHSPTPLTAERKYEYVAQSIRPVRVIGELVTVVMSTPVADLSLYAVTHVHPSSRAPLNATVIVALVQAAFMLLGTHGTPTAIVDHSEDHVAHTHTAVTAATVKV